MLPNDEKSPAIEPSRSTEANKSPMAGLQNPLHGLYDQSMNSGSQNLGPQPSAAGATPLAPAAPIGPSAPQQAISVATTAAVPPANDIAAAPLSEEAWTEKIKVAIEQTQHDPYRRMQVLQQLRAAYQAENFRKGGVESS